MLIVQACEYMDYGDGYYRLHEPARLLGQQPDVTVIEVQFAHRYCTQLMEIADVLVVPFAASAHLYPLIENRRATGKVTVLETNDYYYDLQPYNPIYEPWLNPDLQTEHEALIAHCDAVQTSSPRLADHWGKLARRVAVFRNQLSEFPECEIREKPEHPVIGWGGSGSHLADWHHTSFALNPWLKENSQAHLSVMTYYVAQRYIQLPKDRYRFRQASTMADYRSFLAELDIGIAPLLPSEYNRCRSDVKFLEYASYGIAGIYQNLEPYADAVQHGKTGFLYSNESELVQHLTTLTTNHELRTEIAANALEHVRASRRAENHVDERLSLYRELLSSEANTRVAAAMLADAECEGNYYRLQYGEKEKIILELSGSKPSEENVKALEPLVAAEPHYPHAATLLCSYYNDLKQTDKALDATAQLLEGHPDHPTAHLERGRALFHNQQPAEAVASIHRAAELAPAVARHWVSLIRAAVAVKAAHAASLVEEARKLHPRSIDIALAGVSAIPREDRARYMQTALTELSNTVLPRQLRHYRPRILSTVIAIVGTGKAPLQERLALLQMTMQLFKNSARLHDLTAQIFDQLGNREQALQHYSLARSVQRIAEDFQQDYPRTDDADRHWQMAAVAKKYPPDSIT